MLVLIDLYHSDPYLVGSGEVEIGSDHEDNVNMENVGD